ncbi:MAG: ribose-phosphate diphosphokinase [Spirochaetaceae bacterium]|jgi:ribose-phosphate pyrophosphokinase|nr:ribose-phosphate diphosphokinase [Spirochaetaceae bacterium]
MHKLVITATRSMRDYAAQVVKALEDFPHFSALEDIDGVALLNTSRFADGEMEVAVTSSIRGKDAVLFTSCARNEAAIGVTEAKIELYHAVDAMKRCQPRRIIVFEPFVSCSRSDRTTGRSSVGLWVHFKTLMSLGTQHIVTYQLHSDKSKSIIDPAVCAVDDIPALNLLKQYLCDKYIRDRKTLETLVRRNWAFCSVDAGGEKIARGFANAFGAPLVVAHKQRDYAKVNTIESINILSAEPLEGKVLWIVDDMVDTGGSVESLIRTLGALKPAEINIIAVHPIFSPPASQRLRRLTEEGLLQRIMVTDTVHCPCSLQNEIPGLEVVSSVALSAKVINAIFTNSSMRKLLRVFNAELYLSGKNQA